MTCRVVFVPPHLLYSHGLRVGHKHGNVSFVHVVRLKNGRGSVYFTNGNKVSCVVKGHKLLCLAGTILRGSLNTAAYVCLLSRDFPLGGLV